MAITTNTTLTLRSLTVGVSKPLDQIYSDGDYTLDELIKFSWCSWSDKVVRCWTETTYDSTIPSAPMALLSYIQTHDGTSPAYYTPQYVDDRYQTKEFYCFNILLYNSSNASPRAITSSNASSYRLVTDIDITKIYCNCGNASLNTVSYKYPAVSTYQYADSNADGYYEVFEKATDLNVSGLIPACVLIGENNEIYITHGFMFPGMDYRDANDSSGTHYNNSFIDYSLAIPTGNLTAQQHFSVSNAKIYNYDKSKNILTWLDNGFGTQDLLNEPTNGTYNAFFPIDEHTYFALHQSSGSMSISYCQSSIGIRDMETLLTEMAFVGLYFKVNNTMYKPVIGANNVVEGYTDDMDADSQIDNITNVTGNTISPVPTPPTPPTPSGDDDYESMTTGFASTLSGCTKYYLMSPLDIVTLIRDYYTHAFAGSTLSNSIISCYLCGLSPTAFLSTDTPAPIKIPTVAGEAIFESANSYKAIGAVLNKIAVGNIAVPRMNNDFHDFSPYTIYEVFIPYCGWISLPDTVAGKHIYVEFHVDVRTMAGKAIVLIGADDGGKATCAEMSMNFGASTPFAVIEAGLERQAAVTAGIQTAIGTAAAITGIRSGHSALTVSSIGTAAQGIANGMMSSMANYTQVQGKAGDTSDFANGRQCYLKISWAKTDEVVNNSRFGHSVGYLCNTVGKIKDFKGLTVCANPHVNGIDCTESEKEEIKRLLEDGIIVN